MYDLRIISGRLKGKKIKSVGISSTRETSDRTKETIFNLIGQYFKEGNCLDLFAGSGNLGFESLSRGMTKAFFVDNNFEAVKRIKENALRLSVTFLEYMIFSGDYREALRALEIKEIAFSLIFLDPPYYDLDNDNLLIDIFNYPFLDKEALIVFEHAKEYIPKVSEGFVIYKSRNLGKRTITIIKNVIK